MHRIRSFVFCATVISLFETVQPLTYTPGQRLFLHFLKFTNISNNVYICSRFIYGSPKPDKNGRRFVIRRPGTFVSLIIMSYGPAAERKKKKKKKKTNTNNLER